MRFPRTPLAVALLAVAVLVPTTAWWLGGTRAVKRQRSQLISDALRNARARAETAASGLGERLRSLQATEERRPFYHYQNLFRDPHGAAEGLSVSRSPLASGTPDPLIWAHFQVNERGEVSLPTVNELYPELSTGDGLGSFCEVLAELREGMVVAPDQATVGEISAASWGPRGPFADWKDSEEHLEVLDYATWKQISLADEVYGSLTGRDGRSTQGRRPPPRLDHVTTVTIRVGSLRWHTIVLGSGPSLAALRRVVTPSGTLVQGFVLAAEALAAQVQATADELRFAPASEPTEDEVAVAVAGTGWSLIADAGPALREARALGRALTVQFNRSFASGLTAVLIAGCAVGFIVTQSDRLARQRLHFAAAAAHELKTPLTSIRLHSEMLADSLGDPTRSRDYARRIAIESSRLGRVVINMLDLSRLERGINLTRPMPGDLAAAVDDCLNQMRPSLTEAGVTTEVTHDDDLPPAYFDPDALCQILTNLLDNAEKHTRDAKQRRISISVSGSGDVLAIHVTDSGPGVPRSQRRHVFEPFASFARGESAAGLGLGLAVARSLARSQGGDLALAPSQAGASFVLTVPRCEGSGRRRTPC